MKKLTTTGFLAMALMFGFGCNSNNGSVEQAQETNEQQFEDTAMEDRKTEMSEFMTKAASSNMMEVQLGQMAQEKGQSQDVKDFGKMMVEDHSKANDQLKQLASQNNITLPDSVGADHKDKMQGLRDKTGAEFDKEYMDLMVNAHEKDIEMYEQAAENMQDQNVKSFVNNTLTVLRQHQEKARQINEQLNNNNATTSR